jgi:hypothetical protein
MASNSQPDSTAAGGQAHAEVLAWSDQILQKVPGRGAVISGRSRAACVDRVRLDLWRCAECGVQSRRAELPDVDRSRELTGRCVVED